MKKAMSILAATVFCCATASAQKVIEGTSGNYSFSITKEVKPPILSIVEGSVRFVEPGGNNVIDAGESCKIVFSLENTGLGDGTGLTLKVSATGTTQGITFAPSKKLEALKVGKKADIEIPITADLSTTDGKVTFTFKVDEPNGFGSDEKVIEVRTLKFLSPLVQVVDYLVTGGKGGSLVKKAPFDLQAMVQNMQYGKAENVSVKIFLPQNVFLLSGKQEVSIPELKPGEQQSIVYSLIVNDLFSGNNIPITLKLSEKYGKFAKDKTLVLTLNQQLASRIVVPFDSTVIVPFPIDTGSLVMPVDKNIPESRIPHPERYALIIGNEDYSSRQPGLAKEVNVDFAENDARIFREYAVKTMGVPENHTFLLVNATAAEIRRELARMSSLAKQDEGKAELIFYYSGHGLPDEATREPYLIPVDVAGASIREGIRVSEVYGKLSENPCSRITVFLDACFSGGARNQGLLAMKLARSAPKEDALLGNMVVFSSSSGEESSGVDRKKQHGYFTWFLLLKMQQTKGDITYKELGDYLRKTVEKETTLAGKPQTPQVMASEEVVPGWETWKFK